MIVRCKNTAGEPLELTIEGERITEVKPLENTENEKLLWALPSFADSHVHPNYVARYRGRLAALPPEVNSLEELIEKLQTAPDENGWLISWGYDEAKWPEKRHPTRRDLDRVSTTRPVVAIRNCTHVVVVNSKVLELCGIDVTTPEPPGGVIVRDERGLSGMFQEAARFLITERMPQKTKEEKVADLRGTYRDFYACGITAVTDMFGNRDDWALYEALTDEPMQVAFYADVASFTTEELKSMNRDPEQKLYLKGLKMLCDGSIGSRTAYRNGYYRDEQTSGVLVTQPAEMREVYELGVRLGLEVSAHGMGDKVLDILLDEYAKLEERPPLRLEHCTMMTPELIQKAKDLNVALNSQPIFLFSEIESYAAAFTPEEIPKLYPHRLYEDRGLRYAISSDAPATSWAEAYNPWVGIYGATTRKAYNGVCHGTAMVLTREEAIRAYTARAFDLLGLEAPALRAGAPARLMFYYKNPMELPEDELIHLKPDRVLVGETWLVGQPDITRKGTL